MPERKKSIGAEYFSAGMHVDDYQHSLPKRWAAIVACVSLAASVAIAGVASPFGEGVRNALSKLGETPGNTNKPETEFKGQSSFSNPLDTKNR